VGADPLGAGVRADLLRGETGKAGPGLWIGDLPWDSAEFSLIADRQLDWEDAAARVGSPLLICDTDAFATSLWHERYLDRPLPVPARARHDLWILTDHEGVEFEQDGWRDGEEIRAGMSERFRTELVRRDLPHLVVTGSPETRLAAAADAIDALLGKGWHFTDPL
jgi:nicotinamide riboside kinase